MCHGSLDLNLALPAAGERLRGLSFGAATDQSTAAPAFGLRASLWAAVMRLKRKDAAHG